MLTTNYNIQGCIFETILTICLILKFISRIFQILAGKEIIESEEEVLFRAEIRGHESDVE